MTHDEDVYEAAIGGRRSTNAQNRIEALRSIEPLTLKTEDGCFVLTELAGYTDGQRVFPQRRAGTYAVYRIAELSS